MGMGAGVGKEFTDFAQGFAVQAGPAATLLYEAVQRLRKAPAGRVALVLHLSRLVPPAPRPYHVRIARALLQDTAVLHEGQVFTLGNQDMVLLCAASPSLDRASIVLRPTLATNPATLPAILGRLLRADTTSAHPVVSVWRLDEQADEVAGYARARIDEATLTPASADGRMPPQHHGRKARVMTIDESFADRTDLASAIDLVMAQSVISDLVQRQTAIAFGPGVAPRHSPGALRPIYREVSFSIAALESRLAGPGRPLTGDVALDPFLFRHLGSRLDEHMLQQLCENPRAESGSGMLDALSPLAGEAFGPPLHLNLSVAAVLSDAFSRLALACAERSLKLGIEISLLEAMVDLAAFERARAVLADHQIGLVLDGVSHVAMLIARPWALQPDLLKLDWSPRLLDAPRHDTAALEAAIAETDPARIVLHLADTEAALRWGISCGIRQFQGRHVDAMLAASRIVACAHANECSLRQCVERAASMAPVERMGCRNPVLLERGTPLPSLFPFSASKTGLSRVAT